MTPPRFGTWPTWSHIGHTALLALGVGAGFWAVYLGTDFLTALHPYRVRLHFDAELRMPFVAPAVLVYLSIYLLFAATPFALRQRCEVRALAVTLLLVIVVAGVGFLLFPAELLFEPEDAGAWTGLVDFARRVALRYNLAPSLHVALSVACVGAFAERAPWLGRVGLWGWALAIAVSTLLLHQHYVVDVVTGFVLGLAGVRWVYQPQVDRRRASTAPAAQCSSRAISGRTSHDGFR